VPDLTGAVAAGPPYYRRLAAAAVVREEPVVVIGHSAAGPVLPAIADLLGGYVRAAVFVDAQLPHPGRSWFDTAPPALREQLRGLAEDGWLPPWHEWFGPGALEQLVPDTAVRRVFTAEIPRLPLAYFEEPAPVVDLAARCGYLRLSAAYDHAADEAQRRGWVVQRAHWDHLRMLRAPTAVADLVSRTVDALDVG